MIKLAVTGACGRMGQRIVVLGKESGQFEIAAALENPSHPKLGEDVGLGEELAQRGRELTDAASREKIGI